jgi:Protein of unknown function (DUF4236)
MGFYIRKSISAGPFRFNLSNSGLGMSVGVKGFRLGTGPRGNYVHMGRGGFYYRASLGGARPRGSTRPASAPPEYPITSSDAPLHDVESGNLIEMTPSNASAILNQINEKMGLVHVWPWALAIGLLSTFFLAGHPSTENLAGGSFLATIASAVAAAYWDRQRKTVVILYDLEDAAQKAFEALASAFERLSQAQRIWNIDAAGRINDWKRNAGAGALISRKMARLNYSTPAVIKTNVGTPCMLGGRQSLYFFPDLVLVMEGKRAGAITYDELYVHWSDSIFLETGGVPRDAQVIGYTWQYVNRNGSPDRRFNNNRQIPRVRYQEMGLEGPASFRKVLQISEYRDRADFDGALAQLRSVIQDLQHLVLAAPTVQSA